jgi:hypothetical protein
MAAEISGRSIVTLAKDQVSAELAGELVILDVNAGIYYSLESVGARIWLLIQEPRRVQDIRDSLLEEFDVDPQRCERDLLAFLRGLADKGLLHVTNEAAA